MFAQAAPDLIYQRLTRIQRRKAFRFEYLQIGCDSHI
jgi:c-di-GMP-binding flagellar brake protein YcgR